ncbi:hypothetical protein AAA67_004416 [Salmonella enterica subsp. diarizonae]|nr:hypothetical protein [Salmonella enterica subsp. diarizonae]
MNVRLGKLFAKELLNLPKKDRELIQNFINHVKTRGLVELEGRNKSFENVPSDDRDFLSKVKLAQRCKLWHYHIGITAYNYSKPFGDRTSEYVLHYKNEHAPGEIKIIDFSRHPPFRPPSEAYLC